ncbi:hypothetical protein [Cerasicoccus frondis]|uniref:hypothetical protein n=1 Tax=Cerasicoccus frondis TaxID=490090 RepID=UPI0028527215|nr:hypothetical protein [Cerasicoccus frondis]
MTPRELVLELWELYLTVLEFLVDFPKKLYKEWKKKNVYLRTAYGIIFCSLALGLLTSPLLFQQVKLWRAATLKEEAQSLRDREQLRLAYEKSRSASLLEPDSQETLEQTLDLADKLRHPNTTWWAEKVAKSKDYDPDSLAQVVEHSINFGQLGLGAKYLSIMRTRYPASLTSADMELELLLRQDKYEDAMSKSIKMVEGDSRSALAHRVYVEYGIGAQNEKLKNSAISTLKSELEQSDAVGLELAKLTLSLPRSARKDLPFTTLQLREIIIMHPEATKEDRIAANGLSAFIGDLPQKEAFEAIIAEYGPKEIPDALEVLSRYDIYYGRDQLITEDQVYLNGTYALAYLEWLILSENANLDKAEKMLDFDKERPLPINSAMRRFWQAMIAHERHDDKEFSVRLLQSLENSNANDWDYIHYLLVKHTEPRHQHAFYRELFGRPESPILAAERYLILTYQLGLENELGILLRQIQPERFSKRPELLNFTIYLQAINDKDLAYCRTRLERLIGEYPKNVTAYRTLAYVYAKCNEKEIAKSINAELPPPSDSLNPQQKLMYAYITGDTTFLPSESELPLKTERDLRNALAKESAAL